jgi:methylmalonyl-CoA mutase C-terminal domain/subunit
MGERKIRVLICKPGLDGHDRGAKVVAAALRDAGMEVVYTGLRQTPEMVVETAIQEDVDAVGLSLHSAAHMTIFPKVLKLLRKRGAGHVLLTGGGIIPDGDRRELEAMGIGMLFGPGTTSESIVKYLVEEVGRRRAAARS